MINTSSPIEAILTKLDNVRSTGDGKWSARCPAHDDGHNSLCIGHSEDGRVLLHCQAGCATSDVLAAKGLEMSDLFPRNGHAETKSKREIKEVYSYQDATGKLLFQAVRFQPKGFAQRKPADDGGWVWKLNGVPRVLFRLPELLAADPLDVVWIPEGEKDVLALAERKLVSSCNVGGSGKWKAEYSRHLRGRRIVILPDNDDPGRQHARQVAASLFKAGVASIKVLELPGLPPKGDVSDWLAAGGTVERLKKLAVVCPEWQPAESGNTEAEMPAAGGATGIDGDAGRTEAANARRLVTLHGRDTRYCDRWAKWLHWDGSRWAINQDRIIDTKAKAVGKMVAELAAEAIGGGANRPADVLAFMRGTNSTEAFGR